MIRYMGHGLKLPLLDCIQHPALPVPPSLSGIMALVCPIRLYHILNVPVGSMKPYGPVFQGAKMPSQKAFMPLTLTPRTDGIYQPTNHKKSTPAFGAGADFYDSNTLRFSSITFKSSSLRSPGMFSCPASSRPVSII